MRNAISISLEKADILQTLDALYDRAEAWGKTEALLLGVYDSDFFIPEECGDPSEAAEIAQHFRDIARQIEVQLSNSHNDE